VAVPTGSEVTQPVNAGKAKVKGIELAVSAPFVFLPAPFDGLGFGANATFISAHASGYSPRPGDIPLALQSRRVATAQLFYEKYGFQARIAYSYRSRYLLNLGATAADDQWVANFHQWDVRASYTYGPATVFVEVTNLNDANYRIYVGTKDRVIENERYDYTIRTGVQLAL
jgi:TonB-dependent receptor